MGSKRPWTLVIVLMTIYTYAFVDRVILALLVDPIKASLRVSDFQIGLLLGLAFAGFYALVNLPAGYLVDKLNRRALIGFAAVTWAGMTIVCGLSKDFNQMFLGRAGVGLAEAVIGPAAFSLIRDAVPEKSRGMAFSIYAMSPMIGGALALAGGGYLLHAANAGLFDGAAFLSELNPWRIVLVIIGSIGLPVSLLLLLFKEPSRDPAGVSTKMRDGRQLDKAIPYLRKNIGVYAALVAYVVFSAMMSFGQSAWLPAMLGRKWSIPSDHIGPILGGITLLSGLSGLSLSGYILNYMTIRGYDIRIFGAIAAAGTTVGLAGAALAPTFASALAFAGFGLFFVGVSYPIGATTLAAITPVHLMGKITGGYLLLQTLIGQALGPVLIALGSERLFNGSAGLPYSFAVNIAWFGAAAVVSAYLLYRTVDRPRDRSHAWA